MLIIEHQNSYERFSSLTGCIQTCVYLFYSITSNSLMKYRIWKFPLLWLGTYTKFVIVWREKLIHNSYTTGKKLKHEVQNKRETFDPPPVDLQALLHLLFLRILNFKTLFTVLHWLIMQIHFYRSLLILHITVTVGFICIITSYKPYLKLCSKGSLCQILANSKQALCQRKSKISNLRFEFLYTLEQCSKTGLPSVVSPWGWNPCSWHAFTTLIPPGSDSRNIP